MPDEVCLGEEELSCESARQGVDELWVRGSLIPQ